MIPDTSNKLTIFTYGTLMKGFPNERVISAFPHKNYVAEIRDVEMYNVGRFPALIPGEHVYLGELVVFDEACDPADVYANMDMLEGYNERRPELSLYVRKPITVYIDGEPIETEVYLWNRAVGSLEYINPDEYLGWKAFVS